jgi:hypothetical protein
MPSIATRARLAGFFRGAVGVLACFSSEGEVRGGENPRKYNRLKYKILNEEYAQSHNWLWVATQERPTKGRCHSSNKAWAAYTCASATKEKKVRRKQRQEQSTAPPTPIWAPGVGCRLPFTDYRFQGW